MYAIFGKKNEFPLDLRIKDESSTDWTRLQQVIMNPPTNSNQNFEIEDFVKMNQVEDYGKMKTSDGRKEKFNCCFDNNFHFYFYLILFPTL